MNLLGQVPLDFCVGVAGYPEKHFAAPSLKQDMHYLKNKIEKGAEFVGTQMFFDNSKFFDFKNACIEEGITAPIIPPKNFKISQTINYCSESFSY